MIIMVVATQNEISIVYLIWFQDRAYESFTMWGKKKVNIQYRPGKFNYKALLTKPPETALTL